MIRRFAILAAVLLFIPSAASSLQVSYSVMQDLVGVIESDASWGDFDNDGDLDLVICGESDTGRVTKTFENTAGTLSFHQELIGIDGTGNDCLAWGDYDNDGDLDLAMAGSADTGRVALIYRNDAGTFLVDVTQVLTPVGAASLVWMDRDTDGDLDLYVQGHDGVSGMATLYDNNAGTLTPTQGLYGLWSGSAAWGLYDLGDSRPGLLVTGNSATGDTTILYQNSGGNFYSEGNRGLPNVRMSDANFGDFDNDGDLDVAISGEDGVSHYGHVYENDGWGSYSLYANLVSGYRSSSAWGDHDSDGDLDVAICGYDGGSLYNILYVNSGSGFTYTSTGWSDTREGSLTWADVNNDGDLDYFMTGADWNYKYARLYESSGGIANTAPTTPDDLESWMYVQFQGQPGALYINWAGATDAETPDSALYYNLRVGSSPGGNEIMSGTYGTPLFGNMGQQTGISFPVMPNQIYYWSVQSIDAGLRASAWSPEEMVVPKLFYDIIIDAVDDATVDMIYSNTTFDSWIPSMLHVGDFAAGGDIARAYLKFYLAGAIPDGAEILSADLLLECVSVSCYETFYIDVWEEYIDNWDETLITWSNAPTMWGPTWSWRTPVTGPGIYAWDVRDDVRATVDNNLTLVLRAGQPPEGTPTCIAEFWSKDQTIGMKPHLAVWYTVVDPTGVEGDVSEVPRFFLSRNAPNPFNPSTTIRFSLEESGRATIKVYDIVGREVRTLVDDPFEAGVEQSVVWDGTDRSGRAVPSGIYFYRIVSGRTEETKKMMLLR